MSVLSDLKTTEAALSAELLAECTTPAPNPDEAPGVAWSKHRTDLLNQLEKIRKLIRLEEGAVEIQTIALG